jgi:hypothetical protein
MLREKLAGASLLVIDEVNMVNTIVLTYVSYRLQEVTGQKQKPFGGVNVILTGDFLQLKPVKGAHCVLIYTGHRNVELQIQMFSSTNENTPIEIFYALFTWDWPLLSCIKRSPPVWFKHQNILARKLRKQVQFKLPYAIINFSSLSRNNQK